VLVTGNPWVILPPPAPSPTQYPYPGSWVWVPALLGMGIHGCHGYRNPSRVSIGSCHRYRNPTWVSIACRIVVNYTVHYLLTWSQSRSSSASHPSSTSGSLAARITSLSLTKPHLLQAPRHSNARVDCTERAFRT